MEKKIKPEASLKAESDKNSITDTFEPQTDMNIQSFQNTSTYLHHLIPNVGPTNLFSGSEVEEFLEVYCVITKGLKDESKVKFFPRYCVPSLVDQIKWTEEYEDGNWGKFCAMLKKRYKKKRKSDPFKEIEKLVNVGILSENTETFFQNFDFLTSKLIKEDYITKRQKTEYLLRSLPEGLLEKLSCDIIEDGDFKPYKELSEIISNHLLSENRMDIFKKNSFKNQEIRFENKAKIDNLKLIDSDSSKSAENNEPKLATADNSIIKTKDKEIADLVKQMGAMVLKIDRSLEEIKDNKTNKFTSFERVIRCIYCDGQHSKRDCKELVEDINKGIVKLDDKKNVLLSSGKQLLPNYGNGGMKTQVRDTYKSVKSNLITVKNEDEEDAYDYKIYPEFPNNIKEEVNTFEIVSENEFEKILNSFAAKRKDEDIPLSERVKIFKSSDTKIKENQVPVTGMIPNNDFEEAPYSLKAKIVNEDLKENVLKKCKEALVTMSLEEVASISPFVRKTLNDDFRLRREVKVDQFQTNDKNEPSYNWKKKYLSVGSGKIKGMVQGVKMLLMFDEGSEVNIMSEMVYNGLKSLNRAELDNSIQWKMRDANSGSSKLLGVIKDCEIEIDGVKIKTHIFVSSTTKNPLILGRPWDIKSRAIKENKEDGSLWYTIKDENSDKKSNFCVSNTDDSRRYEDRSNKDENDFEIENFKIDIIKGVKEWGYEPQVYTRYKSAKEKIKPVSIALENIESPSIQKKDMENKIITNRLTEERISKIIVGDGNLSKEEIIFFKKELKKNEKAFAYHPDEMGLLSKDIEDPICVETIDHTPWQVIPYPIPKGIVNEVKELLKDKLVKGILEPTNGPYSNNWFCVQKKLGGLRFIQDVQKVNAVTKKNAGKPPFVDAFAEEFSGYASPVGAGAVLSQEDEKGTRHPCRYESYTFNERERKYPQVKRELLGLKVMVKKLKEYLYGINFILETDAKPLLSMVNKIDLPNDIAARWVSYLHLYDFELVHIKGSENLVADALSRFQKSKDEQEKLEKYVATSMITTAGYNNEELSIYIKKYLNGENIEDKILLSKAKKESKKYFILDGVFFRRGKKSAIPKRVIEKTEDRVKILKGIHEEGGGGHRGRDGTYVKIRDRYHWKSLYNDVSNYVKNCKECQLRSGGKLEEPLKPTWEINIFTKIGVDLVLMPVGKGNMKYLIVARDDFSGWAEARALKNNTAGLVWKFLYEEVICRFGVIGRFVADRGEMTSNLIREKAEQHGIKINFTSSYHPQSNGMTERGHKPLIDALSKYCRKSPGSWPDKLHLALWADRVTTKRTTGVSPFMLVYGQESVLPVEFEFETWNTVIWKKEMTTEELLINRMTQLHKKEELIKLVSDRVKESRVNNKKYFDKKHNLRNKPLEVGDMVLEYNSTIGKKRELKLNSKWRGPYLVRENLNNGSYSLSELDGTNIKGSKAGNRLKKFFSTNSLESVPEDVAG
ncbi:Transposon Ty3-G Gag-Pol polyprotein [Smittium mucronatum]|uniref:Transposon Ty3-G Gag-Pol polyprotein n=1 Tax=Smittium mucronatum TaxID=133383 RepID=A0A1R0GV09_9FUNG|nr:Transposon Ty3-G Gag-Pol polyprotein [Smittium mucronatum]